MVNDRHFHVRLAHEFEDALNDGRPLALCFVDIDDFKRINDRFGHPAGDRVLSQVATRLRQSGEAFRLGGDEFAVLLPRYGETESMTAAESIVGRVAGGRPGGAGESRRGVGGGARAPAPPANPGGGWTVWTTELTR